MFEKRNSHKKKHFRVLEIARRIDFNEIVLIHEATALNIKSLKSFFEFKS